MGLFKKIFKGIGKVFKTVGKYIKKGWRKFGKFMNSLGIFGQLGMMFLTQGLYSAALKGFGTLTSGAMGALKAAAAPGIGIKAKIASTVLRAVNTVKNAATAIGHAGKAVVGGVTKAIGSVLKPAMQLIGNNLQKMGLPIPSWGGKGVGWVGREITGPENIGEYFDAVGAGMKTAAATTVKEFGLAFNDLKTMGQVALRGPDMRTWTDADPSSPTFGEKISGDIRGDAGDAAKYGKSIEGLEEATQTILDRKTKSFDALPKPFGTIGEQGTPVEVYESGVKTFAVPDQPEIPEITATKVPSLLDYTPEAPVSVEAPPALTQVAAKAEPLAQAPGVAGYSRSILESMKDEATSYFTTENLGERLGQAGMQLGMQKMLMPDSGKLVTPTGGTIAPAMTAEVSQVALQPTYGPIKDFSEMQIADVPAFTMEDLLGGAASYMDEFNAITYDNSNYLRA